MLTMKFSYSTIEHFFGIKTLFFFCVQVLHFLASAKTADVITYLMPMLIHCAILQLAEEGKMSIYSLFKLSCRYITAESLIHFHISEYCPNSLPVKLEETAIKAAKVMRNPDPKYEVIFHFY